MKVVYAYQIDYIFDQAARNEIKVIVAPINNWELIDGVPIYLTVSTLLSATPV